LFSRVSIMQVDEISNFKIVHTNKFLGTVAYLYVRYSFLLILISCDLKILYSQKRGGSRVVPFEPF
jgi:hypothetical protein